MLNFDYVIITEMGVPFLAQKKYQIHAVLVLEDLELLVIF